MGNFSKSILAASILLTGCTTTKYVPVVQCQENVYYSPENQQKALAELDTLPADGELVHYMMDYSKIRDANRACEERQKNEKISFGNE